MESTSFHIFSATHLISVVAVFFLSFCIPFYIRKAGNSKTISRSALIIAVLLILHEAFKIYVRTGLYAFPLKDELPFHLCRIAAIITAIMLVKRSYRLFEYTYFLGLVGATQAIIQPDILVNFPHPLYLMFFLGHGLTILGVFYAIVVYRFQPTFKSYLKTMVALNIYGLLIILLNRLLDSNYLFLARKPDGASIIDILGPWPWYILLLDLIAAVLSFVVYLPFLIKNKLVQKTAPAADIPSA